MHIEELRDYCLSKKGVEELMPFGPETLVFKVMGKVFLLVGLENNPIQFNVKCSPDKAIELREIYSCVIPGYHMNKQHWNSILLAGDVPEPVLIDCIQLAYQTVFMKQTKKKQREIAENRV